MGVSPHSEACTPVCAPSPSPLTLNSAPIKGRRTLIPVKGTRAQKLTPAEGPGALPRQGD